LVLSTKPESEATAGLAARVYRSLGLDGDGLPEKEKTIRDRLRAKIRSELIPSSEAAELPGRIPGLGPPDGASGSTGALPIPWAALSIVAEKIARGCEYKYKNRQRLIVPPYGIRTLVRESDFIPEPFASACKVIDFGPGCKIRRLFFTEDPDTVWYFVSIWNTLNMHVRIELETELLKADPRFRKVKGIVPPEDRRMDISPYLRNINQQAPQ
jgi:hypothetical protein